MLWVSVKRGEEITVSKPFVSRDGADDRGIRAEVWVETGTGPVTAVEHMDDDSKRNARISISPTYLDRPVFGWVSKVDPVYTKAVAALHNGQEVNYRVESQRKKNTDRSLPIAELRSDTKIASTSIVRILAGLDGLLSDEAVTNPAEDPHVVTGRIKATTTPTLKHTTVSPVPSGVNAAGWLDALRVGRERGLSADALEVLSGLALACGADSAAVFGEAAQPMVTSPAGRTRPAEAPPYALVDSDHVLNAGSYMVSGVSEVQRWAHSVLQTHDSQVSAEGVEKLTGLVIAMADLVQMNARGGGRPQRNSYSHAVARRLVRTLVDERGLVSDGSHTQSWVEGIVGEATSQYVVALRVAESDTETLLSGVGVTMFDPRHSFAPAQPTALTPPLDPPVDTPVDVPVDVRPLADAPAPEGVLSDGGTDPVMSFAKIAIEAGFGQNKEPVSWWLQATFGVATVSQVDRDVLMDMVRSYQGPGGVVQFAEDVNAVATIRDAGLVAAD